MLKVKGRMYIPSFWEKIRRMFKLPDDTVTEQIRILHNEELCHRYRSPSTIAAGVSQSV